MSSTHPHAPQATEGSPDDARGLHRGGEHGTGHLDDPSRPIDLSFLRFAESLAAPVWSARPDGYSDYYNRRFLAYLGKTLDEMRGRTWSEALHPDDVDRSRRAWEAACTSGAEFEIEYRIRRHDGRYRWHRGHAAPIRDDAGRIARWIGTCTDIDDLRRAEEQARQFAFLAENSRDFIGMCDARFVLTYANRAALEMVGLASLEEFRRASAGDFFFPEDRAFILDEFLPRVLRDGHGEVEIRFRHFRTGAPIWVTYHVLAMKDPSGEPAGLATISRDITARKQAEEAARALAAQYRAVYDQAAVGIAELDLRGRFLRANARYGEIVGYSSEELLGLCFQDLTHPDDWPADPERFDRIGEGLTSDSFERRLVRKDGGVVRVHVAVSRISDGSGRPDRVCAVVEDITERGRLEDELRRRMGELAEADRRKDEFLAMLAHELRNPLAAIHNGLQVMKLASDDGAAVEQARGMMGRQLGQLVRMVDDLLDVSRISQGKIELRKERADLSRVVQHAIETSRPLIEARGHDLTVDVPPGSIHVDADVSRLAQVFSNLLNNAARYTPRGGRVRLAAERRGDAVAVTVRDTGVGIPAPMLRRVFELFTQVDRSLERSQGGLGIGLSLVKGLVELHGGSVEARSEGRGRGSEFEVRLPISATPAGQPRGGSGEGPGAAARRRILVVDDSGEGAATMAMLLKAMGNETRAVHSGREALEVGAAFRPDVILLDIGMPVMSGYDAARRIRGEAWGEHIVLVALTGWGRDDDRRRSSEAGFDFHLVKPVEIAALERILAGVRPSPG